MSAPHGRWSQTESVEALWRECHAGGDRRVRDRLVLTLAPMVKYIAYRKVRELPVQCEIDDFISAGLEALLWSIDRYDPGRGATLEQYAWSRIQGAILDEIRRRDWAPRSLRRREREIVRARERFAALHGRAPAHAELAEVLETSAEELEQSLDHIVRANVSSLNAIVGGEEETGAEPIDSLPSLNAETDPESSAMREGAKARLREALASLSDRERQVAVLLYVHNLTLREIGEALGVTESRVCQIHSQLRRRLRAELSDEQELFAEYA
jgi:RNA polymerase sigma factor for flagellar operon FliA